MSGLVEDGSVIDELGGIAAPGTAYTMSGDGIEAGEYVLICFLPNSEGVPHFQLGMVSGFTIAEGDATQAPEADVTYTVSDEGLDGPSELAAGDTSIEFVNDSATNREITLFKVKEGSTLDDVTAFFAAADEGPPDFAGGTDRVPRLRVRRSLRSHDDREPHPRSVGAADAGPGESLRGRPDRGSRTPCSSRWRNRAAVRVRERATGGPHALGCG